MVAAWSVMSTPALRVASQKPLDALYEHVKRQGVAGSIEQQFCHLRSLGRVLASRPGDVRLFGLDPQLAWWQPVTRGTAATRGSGLPRPHWGVFPKESRLLHYSGHAEDCLYFAVPVRGEFTFECDMHSRDMRVSYAGIRVTPQAPAFGRYEVSNYTRSTSSGTITPPLAAVGESYNFRLEVKAGTYRALINGRQIHQQRLPADHDPWFVVRDKGHQTGGVWNLRFTGNPVVPESLNLLPGENLNGWLGDYYQESVAAGPQRNDNQYNAARFSWERKGDEILGCSLAVSPSQKAKEDQMRATGYSVSAPAILPDSKQESLLQYHRPMLEDGQIEYEFFYEPGKLLVHPSLDRLTFLLQPDGVNIHWLTDAQHDRTGLRPDNVQSEPASRRGPPQLPLHAGQWNRMKLALAGDRLTLTLNEQEIYQRDLEPTNQRFFGLFHYADETEARVRRITYRGVWPRGIPSTDQLFTTR